ncbi:MAG: peptide-methionine (R)-S-oxide reductase MsrB [Bdellovibrionales bacterium]|nr:peptide-methionine (R)-S-oxide reductase MsrB [Bdellovibrionales bacterium]
MKYLILLLLLSCQDFENLPVTSAHLKGINPNKVDWKSKPDSYWKKVLTPLQYYVTREDGTEKPFTGQYDKHDQKGIYVCSNCGLALFSSEHKFDSKTGWPSYYKPIDESNIKEKVDFKIGFPRTEVECSRCGAHLGHVFKDGPKPTGLRFCINSVSLFFVPISQ